MIIWLKQDTETPYKLFTYIFDENKKNSGMALLLR
jgi:hypothetical protein